MRRQTLKDRDTGDRVAYFSISDTDTIDVFETALNCYLAHNVRDGKTAKHHTVNRVGTPETEKDKRQAEAVKMKKAGKTRKEIAEATGLSAGAVSKATQGIKPTKSKYAERDAEIIRLQRLGKSQREIERKMKHAGDTVSNGTLRNVIKRAKTVTKN